MSSSPTAEATGIICLPPVVVHELGRVVAQAIQRHSAPLGGDELLTEHEVAAALKIRVSHARALIREGDIASIDVPGVGRRCTVAAVRKYIASAIPMAGTAVGVVTDPQEGTSE